MNRIEASIGGAFVAILAGCTSAPVPVARDVPPVVSPRPEPRPVAAPKWPACVHWPDDCGEGRPQTDYVEIIRNIIGSASNAPTRVGNNPSVDHPVLAVGGDGGGDVGEGDSGDNPVKGNASANNGTGNYAWTGHADNGKGNGRGRK